MVILNAIRDDAYIISKHTRAGQQVQRDLQRGREAHVFNDDVRLNDLEEKVWREGSYQGTVAGGPRAAFERFVWRSQTPIGSRIEAGKPDLPLHWVEIKGKIVNNDWVYHLTPRFRPAS